MSSNDDLMSSTLYTLLNTLTHGGSTITGVSASGRAHPSSGSSENMTVKTDHSGGKKTDEQRRLVAVTAVEVVARLALEIGRDDVSFRTDHTSLLIRR